MVGKTHVLEKLTNSFHMEIKIVIILFIYSFFLLFEMNSLILSIHVNFFIIFFHWYFFKLVQNLRILSIFS